MTTRSRRRTSRRFQRGKRNYVWASVFVIGDQRSLNGDVDAFPIVVRDDWARDPANGQTIEKGAVLQRIVGNVRVRTFSSALGVSGQGSAYIWGIGKFDEDDAQVLNLTTSFFGEDWMRLEAGSNNINLAPSDPQERHAVDMTVKRKLTSEDEIRFCFGGFSGLTATVSTDILLVDYFFRSLIEVP